MGDMDYSMFPFLYKPILCIERHRYSPILILIKNNHPESIMDSR